MPLGAPLGPGHSGASISDEQDQASLGWWSLPWLSWPPCWLGEGPQSPSMGGLVPRVWSWSQEHEGAQVREGQPGVGNSQHVCVSRVPQWGRFVDEICNSVFSEGYKSAPCTLWMQPRPETCTHARSHARMKCKPGPALCSPGREKLPRALPEL